jgi:hypothetical protein
MTAPLSQLQAWFQQQMTSIGDAAHAWSVDDVIEPSLLRTPAERLSVYQNAYVARLVECLQAEFPAVLHAVGEEAFFQFAVAHLQRHPPQSYTLSRLSAEFAETLAALRPPRDGSTPDFADFVVQLALYERTVNEVFDAEGPEQLSTPAASEQPGCSLTGGALAGLSPDEFATCRLEFYPCVRLLSLQFPVHEYTTAVRTQCDPPPMTPRDVRLVVHRRDYVVRRWEVPRWQWFVLQQLQAGECVGMALDHIAADDQFTDAADLSKALFAAFNDWASLGLFRRLVTGRE